VTAAHEVLAMTIAGIADVGASPTERRRSTP